jgi:competence protein ComGC
MKQTSRRKSSGQALPYMIIMMVALIICWSMMINIAKLLKDRTMMQNAADNAALSMAVNQARTMNILNKFDLIIESILYDGLPYPIGIGFGAMHPFAVTGVFEGHYAECMLFPLFPQLIMNDVSRVAFTPDLYMGTLVSCHGGTWGGWYHSDIVAKVMRYLTEALTDSQVAVARVGPLYSHIVAQEIAKRQEIGANGTKSGADLIIPLDTCALGLLPNKQHIEFYGSEHFL